MKLHHYFLICFLVNSSISSFGQNKENSKNLRIGNIVHDYASYTEILANPQISYDRSGCQVTSFTVEIFTKNNDFFGPYKANGSVLPPVVIEKLEKLKGTECRIHIGSISVNCNGERSLLKAQLLYFCK